MLLGQELKFKNKLCNLKLGTFFSALLKVCHLNNAKSESVNYAAKNPGKRIASSDLLPGFIIL